METNQYRTSGAVDESTFREINKVVLSRKSVWGTRIVAAVVAVLALLELSSRSYFYAAILAGFAAFLIWLPIWVLKSSLDNAVKQLHETHPDGSMQMETWFTEEGVTLHNLSDGAQLVLPYGTLRRAAETKRYFYLVTQANQCTLVFKDLLTPEQKQGFLPFLQGKCPDIKVVR